MNLSFKNLPSLHLLTIGLFLFFFPAFNAKAMEADLVVINANIITVDEKNPRAQAIAVLHERIIAVGTTQEIQSYTGNNTHVIDAQGKTITPGFIDAHCHPGPIYPLESRLGRVDLSPKSVQSMAELIQALKKKAEITPKGQWIRGTRYQDTKLGRHPTRKDLDKVSTEHPIYLTHSSGHIGAANSPALNNAHITKDTPDPPGGAFDRDENGEPTGVLRESAKSIVLRGGPSLPKPTREEEIAGMLECFNRFLEKGMTGVQAAGISPSQFRLYQDTVARGMPVRIAVMFRESYLPELKKMNLRTGFGNDHLKIGAIKVFHGNSLSGRTCWLYKPYAGRPDYFGIPPARSQEELNELVLEIHRSGFQAAIHSNGDREIDMVLNAYENALSKFPKDDHRLRIEHASVVNEDILKRVKQLGVVLALHSYIYEHGDKMEEYGEWRWNMMHANRSALDLGIPVAGNSDYGVSAADPLLRIQSLATRTSAEGKTYGAEQRISVEEAIKVYTLGSAYASFDEDIKGSIEAGKYADFVILEKDPTQVPKHQIKDIKVDATIIGGKVVYQRK